MGTSCIKREDHTQSPRRGSKLRGSSPNSLRVASKREVNITKLIHHITEGTHHCCCDEHRREPASERMDLWINWITVWKYLVTNSTHTEYLYSSNKQPASELRVSPEEYESAYYNAIPEPWLFLQRVRRAPRARTASSGIQCDAHPEKLGFLHQKKCSEPTIRHPARVLRTLPKRPD
ncbi:hypothetical protein AVEN_211091-1 [Araneus ventricosus]|uniref:Uncharacterized protein n=1 Tax=Araneus ventricosus TaxID=182803 RepID=A0A4Y2GVK1_ARAVE|nr:hypothetical protein AVEN_211091-1 [Araneus ventricosus]